MEFGLNARVDGAHPWGHRRPPSGLFVSVLGRPPGISDTLIAKKVTSWMNVPVPSRTGRHREEVLVWCVAEIVSEHCLVS